MPRRPTPEEAREALNVYVRHEIDVATIDVIEQLIHHVGNSVAQEGRHFHGGIVPLRITIGSIDITFARTELVQSAVNLGIGPIEKPEWIGLFKELCDEIRRKHGLVRRDG